MDFEERERQKRRRMLKVFIAEAGMVCSILAIVVVATLAAMGFFVSKNGTIEQSGLMQLHSFPTGATVELDGVTLFSRTNLSRTLSPGEHTIKLSRDGYDNWSKTVKMYSGMLIRLRYPRLFLLNRTQERSARLGKDLEFYSPAADNAYILYALKNSPVWKLVSVRGDDVKTTELDMSKILPGMTEEKENGETFNGQVEDIIWSENSDYVIAKIATQEKTEWILVNLRDLTKSLNLTQTFGLDFTQVKMADDSAGQLFALENHHLRKINTGDRTISQVLLNNVQSFANEGANVIYVMDQKDEEKTERVVGVYRDGERGGTVIARTNIEASVKVALTKYFDEDYMAFVIDNKVTIYYGTVPSYRERAEETDFLGLKALLEGVKLSETPESLTASQEGEYLVARRGRVFMVIDLDMGDLYEYDAETEKVNWLDDSIMMMADDGELKVWDFDFTNQRTLVKTGSEERENDDEEKISSVTTISTAKVMNYPAIISENSKWLYYVVKSNDELVLVREKVRD